MVLVRLISRFVLGFLFLVGIQQTVEAASLFDLQSKWKNVEGQEATLKVAEGSYTLLAMVYTSCPHACPMTISKMQKIEKEIATAGFADLKFLLASFDIKKDTPAALKKYQASRKLDPARWTFLSPPSDKTARELAVVLGVSYKEIGGGDFSHSNIIALLNPQGEIIASIDKMNASSEVFIEALQKAKVIAPKSE